MKNLLLTVALLIAPLLHGQTTISGGTVVSGGTHNIVSTALNVSPSTLSFGTQQETVVNAPMTVTLTNIGTNTINVTSIAIPASDYSQTNTCGATLTSGSQCVVSVLFAPTTTGAINQTLTITTDAPSSPDTVSLTGTGAASAVLFQFSPIVTPASWTYSFCSSGAGSSCALRAVQQHWGNDSLNMHYEAVYSGTKLDLNDWVAKGITDQTALYVRGYLREHVNAGGGDSSTTYRKLIWLDDDNSGTRGSDVYDIFLVAWFTSPNDGRMHLSISGNVAGGCTSWQDYNLATLNYDTWYSLELWVQLDTATGGVPNNDGQYKLWVNGTQVTGGSHATSACWRGTGTTPLRSVQFGVQTDADQSIDEDRYFNDVVAATAYIGP